MKLRLPRNRSIGVGLVWLGSRLTHEAADELADMTEDPVGSVHQARVALKRARSTLRLLEKAGAAWAVPPRFRLTMLAARMSAAREAAVSAVLARKLSRRLRGREREVAVLLAARKSRIIPPHLEQIRQALLQESVEIEVAPAPVISSAQLRHLLRRSLDRATRRHGEAVRKPTFEAVHEWRKAVIVLRDQCALAALSWPDGAGVALPWLVRLARQLGRRGDLALLVRRLQRLRVSSEHEDARRSLIARLERQREQATVAALRHWPRLARRLERLLV